MNISAIETGTKQGYEDYHGDFFDEGYNKIGGWNYDKRQGMYIGSLDDVNKRFYHKNVYGLKNKVQAYLNKKP
jgi:hypothetical protein